MKIAILVLAIIGSVMTFGVGTCTGMVGSAAGEEEMGTNMFMFAIGQATLGLIGGISAYRKFDENKTKKGAYFLLGAAILSIHNTFQAFTSGLFFLIPAIMAFVAKPDSSEKSADQ